MFLLNGTKGGIPPADSTTFRACLVKVRGKNLSWVLEYEEDLSCSLWELAFHTLHVSVDGSALEVGFHSLSKEQIPLENITSCQATSYDWHDYGYGVHLERPKGKMYNVSGDEGIAVDLRLNNEPYKRLLFSSADPKAVCDALKEQNPDIKEA